MRVALISVNDPSFDTKLLGEAFYRLSPQLSLARAHCVFVEIGKCNLLYSEETFLNQCEQIFTQFRVKAQVKIADSLLEALIHSKYGSLDFSKLPISAIREYIDPFEKENDLEKTLDHMIRCLTEVGVTRISDYLSIPSFELPARFGSVGILARERILKRSEVSWPLYIPVLKFEEHLSLQGEEQCQEIEPLLFFVKKTIDRVFLKLHRLGLSVLHLQLTLNQVASTVIQMPKREFCFEFILPLSSSRGALSIIREKLSFELTKYPLEAAVCDLSLLITKTTRRHPGQQGFFHTREEYENTLFSSITELGETLGQDAVFRSKILEEAVPEKAWEKTLLEQTRTPYLNDYIPLRPTKVLLRPERIQITNDSVYIRKRPYKILNWSRVEQIQTYWFQSEIVRSYYKIDLEKKSPVWVFKSQDDVYYLHGYFG